MQYRKRKTTGNLTKRVGPPRDKGGSTSGPVRLPTLPSSLRNRPRVGGETSMVRLRRLVRDTPPCAVCGSRQGLTYERVDGVDRYRCADHINWLNASDMEYRAVKHMTRYNVSDRDDRASE